MEYYADKDDTKRKSRNLSEKKRRDQFNVLINELGTMVSPATHRKMDKTSLLRCTIAFLKDHNEAAVQSRANEIQEDWKPAFLSNEEFTHLMLEALDGFILAVDTEGLIHYVSESVASLLGHVPNDLNKTTIYDLTMEEDKKMLHGLLQSYNGDDDQPKELVLHLKRSAIISNDEIFELVKFKGHFCQLSRDPPRPGSVTDDENASVKGSNLDHCAVETPATFFVATARLQTAQLIRELPIVSTAKQEFTSRYSLEWKFLFLDHRAPPIIGFLPFELLGTSGYDYYHPDDLERVTRCHEALMQTGEGTSCCHRFFTKGQNWIWLQTRYFITYHQWNSKPEFVVATHRVLQISEVIKLMKKEREHLTGTSTEQTEEKTNEEKATNESSSDRCKESKPKICPGSPSCSSKSSLCCSSSTRISHEQSAYSDTGRSDSTNIDVSHSQNQAAKIGISGHIFESRSDMGVHKSQNSRSDQIRETIMNSGQATSRCESGVSHAAAARIARTPQDFVNREQLQGCSNLAAEVAMPPPNSVLAHPPLPSISTKPRIYLTPAQIMLQEQLRSKHSSLSRRIAQQQEELRKISDLLFLSQFGEVPANSTSSTETSNLVVFQYPPPQQQQNNSGSNMCTHPNDKQI